MDCQDQNGAHASIWNPFTGKYILLEKVGILPLSLFLVVSNESGEN